MHGESQKCISNLSNKFPGFQWFFGFSGFQETWEPRNLETCNDNNGVAKIFNLLNNNYNNMTCKCKWGIKCGAVTFIYVVALGLLARSLQNIPSITSLF